MSKNNTNKKAHKATLRRLLIDMGKNRKKLYTMVVVIGCAKIALSIAPRVAGKITDYLSGVARNERAADDKYFISMLVLLAALYFLGHVMDYFITKGMIRISQTLVMDLRNKSQKKLGRMNISYLDNHPVGDILSRLTNDMVTLSNGVESTVPSLIGQTVLLFSLFLVMIITNFRLGIIYLIIFPIGLFLMRKVTKKTAALFKKQSSIVGEMNGLISDSYSNHMIICSYGCEEEKQKQFDEYNKKFKRVYVKSRFLSGIVIPLSILTNNASYVALCVVGGMMLISGKMSIGEFLAFILYGNMVGVPMTAISNSLNNVQNALAAASRVYDFLDEEEMEKENPSASIDAEKIKGEVSFEHVGFGYTKDHQLMKDVSFVAPKGSMSAIVGPSGAGKTTLINLLMRFYEIDSGKIYLDGIDTKKLSKDNLRKGFGMVLQDSWIFDGTIAENISYGKMDASMEEIQQAAKKAQCDDFILRLKDGYNTRISEENSGLSAGEKQLLTIARTILTDPPILILDEATSQVDTRTEFRIVKAMEELTKGRTTFMIAHRLFTIKNADQIMYMENGDIKEIGNHKELLRLNGKYAKLYNS